jgi:hypothetical protein
MPVIQFREEFGGDIAAAVLQDLTSNLNASKVASSLPLATSIRSQQFRGTAVQTPNVACTTQKGRVTAEVTLMFLICKQLADHFATMWVRAACPGTNPAD